MPNLRRVSMQRFKDELFKRQPKEIVVLAGAGVSMIAPTNLPSGDRLRDVCVEYMLTDPLTRPVLRKLLKAPGYRGLLPEVVLQMIGSTIGKPLDLLMDRLLKRSTPNLLHRRLVAAKFAIFTTNFDTCFEKAGAKDICHLHGSIRRPEQLQNQLYRLGKTAQTEALRLEKLVRHRTLLVVGYSFRDDDVVNIVTKHPPTCVLYLSFDGTVPEALRNVRSDVMYAVGSAQQLFGLPLSRIPAAKPLTLPRAARLPPVEHRSNALIRICSRAGLYDVQLKVLGAYLPKLHGRQKLLAMCEVADSLRLARLYKPAEKLAIDVLRDPSARKSVCRDVVSTALVQRGLISLDRGDTDFAQIETLFRQALQVFEQLVASEPPGKYEAENDIWRARIFNNLGLVLAAQGKFRASTIAYQRSLRLKAGHHDRYGMAQTYANLAKAQILAADLKAAASSTSALLRLMKQVPDAYICADGILGCLTALRDTNRIVLRKRDPLLAAGRSKRWWRNLANQCRSGSIYVKRIASCLVDLNRIREERLHG